jgi:signal transduction histidine kinase
VNNAVKHAHARHIVLRLEDRNGKIAVQIADDGIGFRAETEKRGTGLGLMRHRAGLIGAELAVQHPRTGGTVISCTWPAKQ